MTNPRDDLMALAPCPFCHGAAYLHEQEGQRPEDTRYSVHCDECEATHDTPSKDAAVTAWNRRTAASRPATQVVDREAVARPFAYRYVSQQGHEVLTLTRLTEHEKHSGWTEQPLYAHPPKSPDISAAVIQSHALKQALDCLSEIAGAHIPDCPAHYAGEELAWAQRHVGSLRLKAEIARDGIAAAIRQLPTSKD